MVQRLGRLLQFVLAGGPQSQSRGCRICLEHFELDLVNN